MQSVVGRTLLEDLKIELLSRGVRASRAALEALGGSGKLTVHEYATTGGIPLRLAGLDINAPFDEWYCDAATASLDFVNSGLQVRYGGEVFPVERVYPLPSYLQRTDERGVSVSEYAYTHVDRFRLSPIAGCAYDCTFCDMPGRIRLHDTSDLLRAAEIAMADRELPPRHGLISGGSPGPRDEAAFAQTMLDLVEALSERTEIDVMMSAGPTTMRLVEQLVDVGVHGFSINIEIESDSASALHIRGKHRRARPHFDETVHRAVELLGPGRVRSLIIPGLETADQTVAGVTRIASLGADPVLSPFRPAQGTALESREPVSPSLLREVLDESRAIVRSAGVQLGPRCIPCQHNTLTFPWDGIVD